jgi:Tfp pilus assembly protein PilV
LNRISDKGQTLLELVVGLSLVTVIIGALAITTTYSLRNSQFSKNQTQATKFAQEYMEKVRTIKASNYGVCFTGQSPNCSSWEDIWTNGTQGYSLFQANCVPSGCRFNTINGCTTASGSKAVCLRQISSPASLGNVFTGEIVIENEPGIGDAQKRVTANVYWSDASGQHSSDLVTVFSKI